MIDASHAQTNGIHPGAPGIARAALLVDRDPLGRVFELGSNASKGIAVALLIASAAHAAAAVRTAMMSLDMYRFARSVQEHVAQRLVDIYEIDEVKPPEPPPPEPEPEPAKAAPPPPKAPKDAPPPPPPPPEAAKAAAALTADPNDVVDFSNTIITGKSDSFGGGVTQSNGTGKAVYNPAARAGGTPGGTGTAPPPPPMDRSRAAGLLGDQNWNCPWPSEADSESVDEAYVTVEVLVGTNGRAQQVTVVKDPGHGFGREARQCAMQKPFATQLDVNGNPVAGKTKPFRIHFER
ncbi:energy transducer TonB [Pendulispora rubella]|uniref:Energy transducer TonB n=1 Tax=Pendulispora rubella TaxID=2741070 RepID=A0ABZ2LAP2_9BACT